MNRVVFASSGVLVLIAMACGEQLADLGGNTSGNSASTDDASLGSSGAGSGASGGSSGTGGGSSGGSDSDSSDNGGSSTSSSSCSGLSWVSSSSSSSSGSSSGSISLDDAGSTDSGNNLSNYCVPSAGSAGTGTSADTTLAAGLNNPSALTAVGNDLYWVDLGTSTIRSVAKAGGTPQVVLSFAGLLGDLATDGASLYFTAAVGDGGGSLTIVESGLDGSNPTSILPLGLLSPGPHQQTTQLFTTPCGVYFAAVDPAGQLAPFTLSPGQHYEEQSLNALQHNPSFVGLAYVNAWSAYSIFASPATSGYIYWYYVSPIGGGLISLQWGPNYPTNFSQQVGTAGGLFFAAVIADDLTYLYAYPDRILQPPGTVTGPVLAILEGFASGGMVVDGTGMYLAQTTATNAQCSPGIYSISMPPGWATDPSYVGGRPTLIAPDSTACSQQLVLDATNVYWVSGCASGPWTLHGVAR